jgi:hypothetical protein
LATAETLYDAPELRPFTDLDLLIVPEKWGDTREALLEAGGRPCDLDVEMLPMRLDDGDMCDHWLEYRSRHGLLVECALDPLQLGLRTRSLSSFFENALPLPLLKTRARRLAPEHELVQLCVHLNRHGFRRLIWWVDIGLLLRKQGPVLRWDVVEELSRLNGVEASVYFSVLRVSEAFQLHLPDQALEALRPSWLRRRIWLRVWPDTASGHPEGVHEGPLVFRRSRGRLTLKQLALLDAQNILLTGRAPEKLRAIWTKVFPPKRFLIEKSGGVDGAYPVLWAGRTSSYLRRRSAGRGDADVAESHEPSAAGDAGLGLSTTGPDSSLRTVPLATRQIGQR